jgi:hypothetical protein
LVSAAFSVEYPNLDSLRRSGAFEIAALAHLGRDWLESAVAVLCRGDALLTSLVAPHDRAALDRGGWTKPLGGSGCAVGSPLLGARPRGGVTLFG